MAQPRVPAWKRLGLKLKYANELENSAPPLFTSLQSTASGTSAADVTAHGPDDYSSSGPPSKKRRVDEKPDVTATLTANALTRTSSLKSSGNTTRKSVSFTPETKEDDGESSNFMQDKWDEEARNDQINDFLAREAEKAEVASAAQVEGGPQLVEPIKKAKKPKKEKKGKLASGLTLRPPEITRKSADALDYLRQYQSSRSSWKFNKNREVWLLKHVLSTGDIPADHESALLEYLAGMKSENAKSRMIDQCHDCIVAEFESGSDESDRALMSKSLKMDTKTRRLTYYQAAQQRFKVALDSLGSEASQEEKDSAQTRYDRVDRAAQLLKSLLTPNTYVDEETIPDELPGEKQAVPEGYPPTNGKPRKVVPKKKKNRTAVVDISSSSEDTSSDSSDDDSSSGS